MKKKVLLLTTIYPASDLKYGTSAIHYFTREWAKSEYEVKVIHFQAVYPFFFYWLAKLFREIIASRTGAVVFTKRDREDKTYNIDGVSISRFPIFKWLPHGAYSNKIISKQIDKILKINKSNDFVPDIIVGHFSNPQLEIVSKLKSIYNSKSCMVMHDVGLSIKKIYKKNYQELMNNIDVWGYRSMPIKNGFEKNFGIQNKSFLCYSGIPDNYIAKDNMRTFENKLFNFAYVGELIKRKHPISLISAINDVYSDKDFHISYIGRGNEKSNIQNFVNSLMIHKNVSFLGFISRDNIHEVLDETDCMIMISSNETFGLVYLEAMARGCITIGSKGEGIDGVICHGVNGFLCEAGNSNELSSIIRYINSLTKEERRKISENAISTVMNLTDSKSAKNYIESIN